MPQWNVISSTAICQAHSDSENVGQAKLVFDSSVTRNARLFTAVISAYALKGHHEQAKIVFDKMPEQDVVSCTAFMVALSRNGEVASAKSLFDAMPERNVVSWTAMVQGYAQLGSFEEGKQAFDRMPMTNLLTWNSMISLYDHNGLLDQAQELFDTMPERDIVSWNAIVVAHHSHGNTDKGLLDEARKTFDKISRPNANCWNAMLSGYVTGGQAALAIELFREMDLDGVGHEDESHLHVLTACSHAGLVEDGRNFFISMSEDYGLELEKEHYGAMVDLLGRNGRLEEAEELVRGMPFPTDEVVWGILLGACKTHEDLARATRAGESALESTTVLTSSYVMLSSIYKSGSSRRMVTGSQE